MGGAGGGGGGGGGGSRVHHAPDDLEPDAVLAHLIALFPERLLENAHERTDLGGGALLDLGVYGVSLAHMLLGRPDQVSAEAIPGPTGVDRQITLQLGYDGKAALISSRPRRCDCRNSAQCTAAPVAADLRSWRSTSRMVARLILVLVPTVAKVASAVMVNAYSLVQK